MRKPPSQWIGLLLALACAAAPVQGASDPYGLSSASCIRSHANRNRDDGKASHPKRYFGTDETLSRGRLSNPTRPSFLAGAEDHRVKFPATRVIRRRHSLLGTSEPVKSPRPSNSGPRSPPAAHPDRA